MKPLTTLVGRPSTQGGWEITPKDPHTIDTTAGLWSASGRMHTLQVRPGLVDGSEVLSGEANLIAGHLVHQIPTGMVKVVVRRPVHKGAFERSGRQGSEVVEYPVDRPFQVSTTGALLVLNRPSYSLIFEEVDDGSGEGAMIAQPQAPLSPTQAQNILAMEKEMRARMERIAALEARLEAQVRDTSTSKKSIPKPKPKR